MARAAAWVERQQWTLERFGLTPSIELYNLTARVGIHPVGSSVARCTLESHGYYVPPLPVEEFAHS